MPKQQDGDGMVRLSDFCTTGEAADILGCTDSRVRQLRLAGKLGKEETFLRLGPQSVLIPRKVVEKFAKVEQKTGRPRKNSA